MLIQSTIIALTIYSEAGNQDYLGKILVAQTIKQRARDRGLSYIQVCREPRQYSCWNSGNLYLPQRFSERDWLDCVRIAHTMKDISLSGFTHYHKYNILPTWARYAKRNGLYMIHGDHIFYRAKDLKNPSLNKRRTK